MAIASILNEQAMRDLLSRELLAGMTSAAEPVLQKALADIEAQMRKKLAAMLVGFVEQSYDMATDGRTLTVRVAMGKESNPCVK